MAKYPVDMNYDDGTVGLGGAIGSGGVAQGIYEVSTTQKGRIGSRLEFDDGRVFRYGYFSGAIPQGKVAAADATQMTVLYSTACWDNSAGVASDQPAGATTVYLENSNITVAAVGSTNVLQGGFLSVATGPSGGYTYKIRNSSFIVATSVLKLDLKDPLVEAINSEDGAAIIGSPYGDMVIYNAATDDVIAGVTVVDMAAGEYGWVQTWGECTCLTDGAGVAGTIITGSDGVDGAIQPMGGGGHSSDTAHLIPEPILGYYETACVTAKFAPIYLMSRR